MQLKTLSIIAGAIALTLTATPYAVKAQTDTSVPVPGVEAAEKGPWKKLNLTSDQQNKIQTIISNTRTKIEGVLTPEQKDQLKKAVEARQQQRAQGQRPQGERQHGQGGHGRGPGKGFGNLNLTDAQKKQIREIRESSKKEIEALLTPDQQAKLAELKKNHSHRQRGAR